MAAERDSPNGKNGAPGGGRGWRIVRRAINQHGDAVFDVFHGADRRAWGLKDEDTAQRWLRRLSSRSAATPPALLEPERSEDIEASVDAASQDGDETTEGIDGEAYVPPRVWWNET